MEEARKYSPVKLSTEGQCTALVAFVVTKLLADAVID